MAEMVDIAELRSRIGQAMPKHVGIIMDGNGRWATGRGLPRAAGHRAGVDRLKGIIRLSSDLGIQALSLYAFSTENWKRPEHEKEILFSLLMEYFSKEIDELNANRVEIRALGDIARFPRPVRGAIEAAISRTAGNRGLKLSIALNYGSISEVIMAARALAADAAKGALDPDSIDERALMERLYTKDLLPVDLVIRTGGEKRLSNFLLLQAAYAELMFVDEHWPDFSDRRYADALVEFSQRNRRYGGL